MGLDQATLLAFDPAQASSRDTQVQSHMHKRRSRSLYLLCTPGQGHTITHLSAELISRLQNAQSLKTHLPHQFTKSKTK